MDIKRASPEVIAEILKVKNRHLSLASFNPFIRYNSASRGYMASTAINGFTQVLNPQERLIFSTDLELGKGVMNITIDEDAVVKRLFIKRTPRGEITKLTIAVVYVNSGKIDFIDVPLNSDNNYTYGFRYIWQPVINQIINGTVTYLKKGTVLARTPGSKENGGYAMGYNLNTLFISHPSGAEDTYLLRASKAKEMKVVVYSELTVEYGAYSTLTNAYGDSKHYKPFPDVGEYIREDRLLCAVREIDDTNILGLGSNKDLCRMSPIFDKAFYVSHPNGRVINIEVIHAPRNKRVNVHDTEHIANRYITGENNYYREIVEYYKEIENHIEDDRLTPHANNSIVKALFNVNAITDNKIEKRYKKAPIDTYRIKFTIEHILTPEYGYKLTNLHGGKGVVIIKPDNEMPEGVDLIAPIDSTIKRMNIGSLYEPYVAGISREVQRRVQEVIIGENIGEFAIEVLAGLQQYVKSKVMDKYRNEINKIENGDITEIWALILTILKPINNLQYKGYLNLPDKEQREIIKDIFLNEFYIYYTPEDIDIWKAIAIWDKLGIKPKKHKISMQQKVNGVYKDIKVKDEMYILPMHYIVLSKIPFDGLMVNTSNINHFGLPVTVTSTNKHRLPYKANPAKFLDETFSRLIACYTPERGVAELLDRSTSPYIHELMCKGILNADIPTNISQLIDRENIPYGNSKPLELVNHVLNSAGVSIEYTKDNNTFIEPKEK